MINTSFSHPAVGTLVEQQTNEFFSYSQSWLDLITKLYGSTLIPLTNMNAAGQMTGFLPLCFMQSPLTGKRLVSLPFSDHCPILAENEDSANDLIDQAIQLAKQQKVRYLELRTGNNEVISKRTDMTRSDLYVRWLLPLAADPDVIRSKLRKPIQHQIKKSCKLGVQVRIAEKREDIAHYYRLHLQTRSKKHGMPAQPQRFFYELWDAFAASSKMQLLLAEFEGNIVAGMILLASGTTVRYAYGASDESYLHLAPNNLLMWTAISWGCKEGYEIFDMGRTATDNEGLMEFKRRWGASLEPLPYYYYPHMEGLSSVSEHSWKFRLLTTCWRQLPLQIAGPLGGHLYKHLG